jgi:hypothetical protein
MFSPTPKNYGPSPSARSSRSGPSRDITWDRPVFRPPVLPNPRVIFDPLPFTAHRLTATARPAHGH